MKKKVVFVLLDRFADWEGAALAAELTNPEASDMACDVLYASSDTQPKYSIGGLHIIPDIALDAIPEDADALVLIGGMSWRKPEAQAVALIAQSFLASGKVVGAICDAARFAGAHGLLNDRNHTCNDPEELENEPAYINAAGYQAQDCVRDGNLVTANGTAPFAFGKEMLIALGVDKEKVQMWHDFYALGYHRAAAKYFAAPQEETDKKKEKGPGKDVKEKEKNKDKDKKKVAKKA